MNRTTAECKLILNEHFPDIRLYAIVSSEVRFLAETWFLNLKPDAHHV